MNVLVLGGDGYLGWPTAMHFSRKGHQVSIVDNFSKRYLEMQLGITPLFPIAPIENRIQTFYKLRKKKIRFYYGDINDYHFITSVLKQVKPDSIIHYGEQPSAPYSMIDVYRARETQQNNVIGTLTLLFAIRDICPDTHLVKLGTLGEYGTPNIPIEEGFLTIHHKGRNDTLPFPKQANSFYHLSKVHDSHNIMFACKTWGLRSTDLNQGIVYGLQTPDTVIHDNLQTSFHYDDIFGTVLNRFCVQAVAGIPLTLYGQGNQKRGFLNINDTIACVELTLNHPPKPGEYRVFNQFAEVFTLNDLARLVVKEAKKLKLNPHVQHISNPRVESENHYYEPSNSLLRTLGYKPKLLECDHLVHMLKTMVQYRKYINKDKTLPQITWKKGMKL